MNRNKLAESLQKEIIDTVDDNDGRKRILFKWINRTWIFVAICMFIIDMIFQERLVALFLLGYLAFTAVAGYLFIHHPKYKNTSTSILMWLIVLESILLFIPGTIVGAADGFSPMWFVVMPVMYMYLLGQRKGAILCGILTLFFMFAFWTPAGRSLLAYDYSLSFYRRFPVLFLASSAIALLEAYFRNLTQARLVEIRDRNQYLSNHDGLTGAINRHGYYEFIGSHFEELSHNEVFAMLVEIDFFKKVNDTYGHHAGDIVLQGVTKVMKQEAGEEQNRDVLASKKHVAVCRWGGEEFIIIGAMRDAMDLAERIRKRVEATTFEAEGQQIHVTVSIGVALGHLHEQEDMERLIKQADVKVYESKQGGRNRVTV